MSTVVAPLLRATIQVGLRSLRRCASATLIVVAVAGCATRPTIDVTGDSPAARLIAAGGTPAYNAAVAMRIRGRSIGGADLTAIEKAASSDDFGGTSKYCQDVLSNLEQRADTMRWAAFATAMVGTIAGAIVVPALVAQTVVAKSSVAAWGGLSGATNAAQGYLRAEGLDAQSTIDVREKIRLEVLAAIQDYGTAAKSDDPKGMAAAVTRMFAACHFYAIASASAILQNPTPSGNQGQPKLTFTSQTPLVFAATKVGDKSTLSVTVTNSGTGSLTIKKLSISGDGSANFDAPPTTDCPTSVAAGVSCKITVTFHPKAAGQFAAQLDIETNGEGSPQTVKMTATGS